MSKPVNYCRNCGEADVDIVWPKWSNYRSTDHNGEIYFWENAPVAKPERKGWFGDGWGWFELSPPPTHPDWHQSLIAREDDE